MYIPYTLCCIPICPCCFFAPFLRQLQQAVVSNLPLAIRVQFFLQESAFQLPEGGNVVGKPTPKMILLSYSTYKCWDSSDKKDWSCYLTAIQWLRSTYHRFTKITLSAMFQIRFFAEQSVFCPKNCTQTAKKAHQNKKTRAKVLKPRRITGIFAYILSTSVNFYRSKPRLHEGHDIERCANDLGFFA